MMGSYAIVGAHLPIALGAAWSAQYRKSGQVAVCFFGDGTTNIGAFHEALNLAAVWKAPVVFVCENNQYMEYTRDRRRSRPCRGRRRTGRRAYGLERDRRRRQRRRRGVRGRARRRSTRARERRRAVARRGAHVPPRRPLPGRSRQVPAGRRGRGVDGARPDPGASAPGSRRPAWTRPTSTRSTSASAAAQGRRRAEAEARDGAGAGVRSTDRDQVWADGGSSRGGADLSRRDRGGDRPGDGARRSVVLIGEDVGAAGGVFKLTEGLFDRFGPERVRDTPISEQAIVGAAMGAAMTGLRPIAELMFSDFFAVTWDMVANQIAKTRYMTDGQVVAAARAPHGERRRACASAPSTARASRTGRWRSPGSRSSRRRPRPT